jgi:hypothetical protein
MCAYEKDFYKFGFFVLWHSPLFAQGGPFIAGGPAGWGYGRAGCRPGTPHRGVGKGAYPALCWFISKKERQIMLVAGYDKEELT